MKFDLHSHTIYSEHWFWGRDALDAPRTMIKAAIKKGLEGLAITDHQTVRGGLAGLKIAKSLKKDFIVIPGIEIRTLSGDLLGLDIKKDVPDNLSIDETIERIHALGGIAVAPHPFAKFVFRKCVCMEAVKADAIEVFNAGSSRRGTDKLALKIAENFKKPKTAGSDAHWHRDVGNAGIICNSDPIEEILKNNVKIFGNYTHYSDLIYHTAAKFMRSIKWRILKTKPKYV